MYDLKTRARGEDRTRSERWDSESGAMAVIAAILISIALLGVVAAATDIGFVADKRSKLQVAADAAALAAAARLAGDPSGSTVPAIAQDYAARNATLSRPVDVNISGRTITVTAYGDANLGFAQVWGKTTQPARASASAVVGSPTTLGRGLMPFALMAINSKIPPYGLTVGPGGEITLETGVGTQGNYHMVDLTSYAPGCANSKQVIGQGGSSLPISIGTELNLQTGTPDVPNYSTLNTYLGSCSHTFADLFDANGVVTPPLDADGQICNRVLAIPIVVLAGQPEPACYDWATARGASIPVTVIGFAHAFVQGTVSPSSRTLTARFIQIVDANGLQIGPVVNWAGVSVGLTD